MKTAKVRIALVSRPLSESFMRLVKQIGVTDIVSALPEEGQGPVWEFLPLLHLRKRVEDAGLNLSVIETIPISDRIKLGLPGRDEDLDNFCQSLRNMGAAVFAMTAFEGWESYQLQGKAAEILQQYLSVHAVH